MSKNDYSKAVGAQPPLGFWDPLGLLKDADQERFDRLRSVELKHGRISMLAVLGHLVTTSGGRLPGDIAYGVPFASMKNGLAVFETLPTAGLVQIVSKIVVMINLICILVIFIAFYKTISNNYSLLLSSLFCFVFCTVIIYRLTREWVFHSRRGHR